MSLKERDTPTLDLGQDSFESEYDCNKKQNKLCACFRIDFVYKPPPLSLSLSPYLTCEHQPHSQWNPLTSAMLRCVT